jgi:Na+-driven multidrug efflux pump
MHDAVLALTLLTGTAHAHLTASAVAGRTLPQLRAAPRLCSATESTAPAARLAPPEAPADADIRRFVLPCLGLWLSQPLLSLVDTSAVLGPATTFCDGANYLFAFLNVATTNLYASAAARAAECGPDDCTPVEQVESEAVVRCAARVSLLCGVGAMLVVLALGTRLLKLYVGPATSADAAILGPAAAYVSIRSLSFPAPPLFGSAVHPV